MTPAPRGASWTRAFLTTLQFLTRLPVPGGANADPDSYARDVGRVMVLLPLVGGLIGCATALVLRVGAEFWPFAIAVLLALSVEALLTGALHEDAAADFLDAFGGARTREDLLRIMKDSRVGAFGLVGLVLLMALRAGALVSAGDAWAAAAMLVISGVMGRLAMVVVLAAVPPAPETVGLGSGMSRGADFSRPVCAAVLVSPVLIWAAWRAPVAALVLLLGSGAFVFWFRRLLLRRLGGSTGDCVGAAGYFVAVLASLVMSARG